MIGDNFFKIFSLKQSQALSGAQAIQKVNSSGSSERINKDKQKQQPKPCVGCPDKETDRCSTCLEKLEIYC